MTITKLGTKFEVSEKGDSQPVTIRDRTSMSYENTREEEFLSFLHGQYPGHMNDSVATFSDEDDGLFDDCARNYFDWEMQPGYNSEARRDIGRPFLSRIDHSLRKWSTSFHGTVPIKEVIIKTAPASTSSSFKQGQEKCLSNFRESLVKLCDAIRTGLNDELSSHCEPTESKPVAPKDGTISFRSRIDQDLFGEDSSTCSLDSFYLRGGCNDSVVIRQRQFSKQHIKEEKKCDLRNSVGTVTTAASSVLNDFFGMGASFSTLSVGSISNDLNDMIAKNSPADLNTDEEKKKRPISKPSLEWKS